MAAIKLNGGISGMCFCTVPSAVLAEMRRQLRHRINFVNMCGSKREEDVSLIDANHIRLDTDAGMNKLTT